MAKAKKRNKRYQGADAAITPPRIRIEAVQRGKFASWWSDHKSELMIRSFQLGLLILLLLFLWFVWSLLT